MMGLLHFAREVKSRGGCHMEVSTEAKITVCLRELELLSELDGVTAEFEEVGDEGEDIYVHFRIYHEGNEYGPVVIFKA